MYASKVLDNSYLFQLLLFELEQYDTITEEYVLLKNWSSLTEELS